MMNAQPTVDFQWSSPLGISVVLFLLSGGLYIFIGIVTPLAVKTTAQILIVSTRTDSIVFGHEPSELLRNDPSLQMLRIILLRMMAGLLVAAGCFQITLTWFGLRQGQSWAFIALLLVGLAVLPFWLFALRPYLQQNVALTLFDIPPFMWVPAAFLIPAAVLGWWGLH
jgi:hypothetical protein